MTSLANISTAASEPVLVYRSASLFHVVLAKVPACLLLGLVLWRAWRFTIFPLLHPDLPVELPYWLPFVAFFRDSNGLLSRARSQLGITGDPFALTAFGTTFYVVTQEKHSAEVYRNSDVFSFEDFVQGLMRTNGNDEGIIKAVYTALPTDKAGFPNPRGESLGVLSQRMHAHQLHPGENLVGLQKQVQAWIGGHLNLEDVRASSCAGPRGSSTSVEVPLYQWCSEYFVRLGQDVYFGETLSKIDPSLPANFVVFDELIWKMLYQYPGLLSTDMSTARVQVIASLKKYFQVPQSQRSGGSAWLINAMEDEMKAIGVDDDRRSDRRDRWYVFRE
ncbi:hypothetical protein HIM_03075 [Hirsutella minnesotensis 3608]|nr:hypothetical protein HIM_03075 [Hirsutella minnesotensis 3608]